MPEQARKDWVVWELNATGFPIVIDIWNAILSKIFALFYMIDIPGKGAIKEA